MRRELPNIITLLNLLSGCIAITMAFQANFTAVVIWVVVAALFDFLDGATARLLKAYSGMGKELDSLADLVSFGVAPAAALFILLRDHTLFPAILSPLSAYLPYLAFIIPLFSAYRLAKFNLDERQGTSFLGLPTPANALFWISYCYGVQQRSPADVRMFYLSTALIIVLSLLMISELPMFSLKIKGWSWKENGAQLLIVLLMIAFVIIWGIIGVAWGILAYIALSIVIRSQRGKWLNNTNRTG